MSEEVEPDAYGAEVAKTAESAKTAEVAAEPDPTNDTFSYFGFGAVTLWGAVMSFMIRNNYMGIPASNDWWKKNCPATAYTKEQAAKKWDCETETLTCPRPTFITSKSATE